MYIYIKLRDVFTIDSCQKPVYQGKSLVGSFILTSMPSVIKISIDSCQI